MATKLNRILIRETIINDKVLLVELSPNNKLSLRIKGTNKILSISFEKLLTLLENKNTDKLDEKDGSTLINLHDFRSHYLINGELDYPTKVKLEAITVQLLNNQ
jgi:hypothetical protein